MKNLFCRTLSRLGAGGSASCVVPSYPSRSSIQLNLFLSGIYGNMVRIPTELTGGHTVDSVMKHFTSSDWVGRVFDNSIGGPRVRPALSHLFQHLYGSNWADNSRLNDLYRLLADSPPFRSRYWLQVHNLLYCELAWTEARLSHLFDLCIAANREHRDSGAHCFHGTTATSVKMIVQGGVDAEFCKVEEGDFNQGRPKCFYATSYPSYAYQLALDSAYQNGLSASDCTRFACFNLEQVKAGADKIDGERKERIKQDYGGDVKNVPTSHAHLLRQGMLSFEQGDYRRWRDFCVAGWKRKFADERSTTSGPYDVVIGPNVMNPTLAIEYVEGSDPPSLLPMGEQLMLYGEMANMCAVKPTYSIRGNTRSVWLSPFPCVISPSIEIHCSSERALMDWVHICSQAP